jgi:hypothetical protein
MMVYRLQAQSFSGPSTAGHMIIFYCLRFETPPTWRARSPYLYPPETGRPSYTPRHWVPLSSPPTTRRATVEVFEPASTRATLLIRIFDYFLWTLKVYYYVHSSSTMGCVPSQMNLKLTPATYFDSDPFMYTSAPHLSSL